MQLTLPLHLPVVLLPVPAGGATAAAQSVYVGVADAGKCESKQTKKETFSNNGGGRASCSGVL